MVLILIQPTPVNTDAPEGKQTYCQQNLVKRMIMVMMTTHNPGYVYQPHTPASKSFGSQTIPAFPAPPASSETPECEDV